MKLRNASILPDLKLLQRRYHLCRNTFSLLLGYIANHQLAITLDESINFLTTCKKNKIFPSFIHNMVSRFSSFRHDCVRSTIRQLKGYLLDAAVAKQKQRRNKCVRNIVHIRAAIHQRLSKDCWRELVEIHKVKCDDLCTQIRARLNNKLNKLQHSSSCSRLLTVESTPPDRCVVLGDNQVDGDVVQMLNLGPNFAPQPMFSDQARFSIVASLCRFGYSYSWKKQIGATAPTLEEFLRMSMPFPRSQVQSPTYSPSLRFRLSGLIDEVLQVFDRHRSTSKADNMTQSERQGLRKALKLKSTLRFSVGDKCGGFVVMSQDQDITLCEALLSDANTYRMTTINRYNQECKNIQETMKKILSPKMELATLARLLPKHPSVPTFYQLVKTHKLEDFEKSGDFRQIKSRPIVSACGGPTDGLSWLLQHMLSPLLNHVPAHIRNVDHFLSSLKAAPIPNWSRLAYQSFDVCALYTNVDTFVAVKACIELLNEHRKDCQLYGLQTADVEELLLVAVKSNIFHFKNQLYQQTRGLAMGSRIAPLLAIIFMNHLERRSLTTGLLFYGRYIDDIFIVGRSRAVLRQTFKKLNSIQPSITLTAEDPDREGFVPYLNTKIKLSEGSVISTWYKKPASKNILLHSRSCHPSFMKSNVVKNVMDTARKVTTTNVPDVMGQVERILAENGYSLGIGRRFVHCWRPFKHPAGVPVKIPFLSDSFAQEVNRVIKKSQLPIQLLFIPPPTLRRLLTSSRLYEKQCGRESCSICDGDRRICLLKGVVYKIQCASCSEIYVGESGRPLFKRVEEHLRALRNPTSYPDNPFSKHRTSQHARETVPKLRITVLHRNISDPVERKIKEALEIRRLKPAINNKEERTSAMELITMTQE